MSIVTPVCSPPQIGERGPVSPQWYGTTLCPEQIVAPSYGEPEHLDIRRGEVIVVLDISGNEDNGKCCTGLYASFIGFEAHG